MPYGRRPVSSGRRHGASVQIDNGTRGNARKTVAERKLGPRLQPVYLSHNASEGCVLSGGQGSIVLPGLVRKLDLLEVVNAAKLVDLNKADLVLLHPTDSLANKENVVFVLGTDLEMLVKVPDNFLIKFVVARHEKIINM